MKHIIFKIVFDNLKLGVIFLRTQTSIMIKIICCLDHFQAQ